MAIAELSIEQSVDLIARGLNEEFRSLLSQRLTEVGKEITEQVAREAAANIVSKVSAYNKDFSNKVVVQVNFNTK